MQRRHQLGKNRRVAERIHSQFAGLPGRAVRNHAVQLDLDATTVDQPLDVFGIGGRALDIKNGLVLRPEREAPSREHLVGAGGAEFLPEQLAQAIVPGARECRDFSFDLTHQRGGGGLRVKAEMQARGVVLAHREIIVEQLALETVLEHVLNPLADFGRERLAGHQDQRDHLPPTLIGQHAEANRGVGLGFDQQADLISQLIDGAAKQFFLGKTVKRGDDFLEVMRAGRSAFRLDHLVQLGAQNRNVFRLLGESLGSEQPDEAIEAGHFAARRDAANHDAVHRTAAVHVRIDAGFGDRQRRSVEEQTQFTLAELIDRAGRREPGLGIVAQNSRTGLQVGREDPRTVAGLDPIATVAEENEPAAHQPAEKFAHLDQLAHRRGFIADLQRAFGHPLEIVSRPADLGQHRANFVRHLLGALRGRMDHEFGPNVGLGAFAQPTSLQCLDISRAVARDPEHRVQHLADRRADRMKIREQAVDDERAIGSEGLDQGSIVVGAAGYSHRDGLVSMAEEFQARAQSRPGGRPRFAARIRAWRVQTAARRKSPAAGRPRPKEAPR